MAAATSPPAAGKQLPTSASEAALAAATSATHPNDRFAGVSPHTLPPSILRLLSLSSPIINGLHDFIQLATWTGPSGGGTRSTLMLLVWTAICLFAYPLLRYAPQLILLSVILCSAIPNMLLPPSSRRKAKATGTIGSVPTFAVQTLTQAQTQKQLQKVSDILDVSSTLHARLVLPTWQALTWQHPSGPGVTIGVAVLCLTLGSLWTICFADWPAAWGQVIQVLPLQQTYRLGGRGAFIAANFGRDTYVSKLQARLPPQVDQALLKTVGFLRLVNSRVLSRVLPSSLRITVFPPFPLFSLRLSHVALTFGLVALSWCSTYATLVRYALWKSATVRWTVRAVLRITSAGYLGGQAGSDLSRYNLSTAGAPGSGSFANKSSSKSQVRTNTVHYRFEIFENQRWWVGLDWTAALLPQERASWTDSSLGPVSPPASFTLPAESVSTRQTEGGKWEKRTVKWSWDEDEWHVVVGEGGRMVLGDGTGEATPTASAAGSPRGPSGALPASPSGAPTLFSSFKRRASEASATSSDKPSEDPHLTSPPSPFNEQRRLSSFEEGEVEEETDSSGWRYGDNSWEKMGSKSGMGKYTRRRRWVRRALMEEKVEIVDAPPAAPAANSSASATSGTAGETSTKLGNAEPKLGDESVESLAKNTNTSEKGLGLAIGTPPSPSPSPDSRSRSTSTATLNPSTSATISQSSDARSPSPTSRAAGTGPSMSTIGVGLGSPKVDFKTRLNNAGKGGTGSGH
ncbi:hypothetical protein BCV69DRAFT_113910 [Microstroma glucosiphilum]|uniref:Peroxin/Ferlin domain-containing protein n=1 Tax=Pseudomicrostroma glucosiphilum TaxID=1684307 RepID=A0A316UDJ1_9BASI|nr:hypothetical protein BCV69DRAFT_113910 [Pseudomicrostroma glucosiphilum]PWN23269.1 hypothetical protein BCV69DRAFT_113910 [Pseudomicrostroma glucosiphilum]